MSSGLSKSQIAEPTDPGASDALVVNLQIVSPSVGVDRPLLFPELPAETTIKQLKGKIRHALPTRPPDESQRLIHRGRVLLQEADSLLDIFGVESLRTPDRQTIHLVVRDPVDGHSPSLVPTAGHDPSPIVGPNQASATSASTIPASSVSSHLLHFGPQPPAGFSRRTHSQPAAAAGSHTRMPSPAPNPTAFPTDPTATFQQQHQNMTNWISQIQREAMARAIVHQNQRGRAHMGMRGIGDVGAGYGQAPGSQTDQNGGRASPAPTHTVHRETSGTNGQLYQVHVEAIIRAADQGQQAALSAIEAQNMFRGVTANSLPTTMASTMQRTASGASVHGRPLNQSGVTTSFLSSGVPMSGSGRATPEPNMRYPTANAFAPSENPSTPSRQGVDVYILSSPEGPRALLINNATAETYYTPRMRHQTSMPHLRTAASFPNLAQGANYQPNPQIFSQQLPLQHQQHYHYQELVPPGARLVQMPVPWRPRQTPGEQPQQDNNVTRPADHRAPTPAAAAAAAAAPAPAAQQPGVHPANPAPAAGIPPMLLRVWPHIWLFVRLAVFVWLFTTPGATWTRWLTVISLAGVVFLLSTGMLNAFAENAWQPIGRHLANLLPTPEQQMQGRQRPPIGPGAAEERQPLNTAELEPAQMAARLVAEHDRQNWLGVQLRRLERAGLLFIASIAPGIAERHIATLEAAAQAEETRRREAAAAATTTTIAEEEEETAEEEDAAATTASPTAEGIGLQVNRDRRDHNNNERETQAEAQSPRDEQHREESDGNPDRDGVVDDLIAL
ncbi:hypothetical protein E4U19_004454 [Claviceps sp. Clav32 group G5]|nr:hypothetical protein E4U19_004454 [Claviceps sp. Clav32 group G5]